MVSTVNNDKKDSKASANSPLKNGATGSLPASEKRNTLETRAGKPPVAPEEDTTFVFQQTANQIYCQRLMREFRLIQLTLTEQIEVN